MESMDIDLNNDLGEGCGGDADIMPLVTSAISAAAFTRATAAPLWQPCVWRRAGGGPGHIRVCRSRTFGRARSSCPKIRFWSFAFTRWNGTAGLARLVGVLSAISSLMAPCTTWLAGRTAMPGRWLGGGILVCRCWRLPGSRLEESCRAGAVRRRGFADRRYLPDGSLVSRSPARRLRRGPEEAVRQVDWLIRERGVRSLCVHGDNPQAAVVRPPAARRLDKPGPGSRAFA